MKKTYHAPWAESISVDTFIIAASTGSVTRDSNPNKVSATTTDNRWGNIWGN